MAEYTTLFTEKYITDKLKLNELVIPNLENKLSVISRWIKENKDKTIYNKKEEQLQSDFLNDIFGEVLGYAYKRGLDIYNLEKEEKSKTDGTKPDGSLGYFTKDNMDTRVVIELKDAYTDLDHKQNRKNDNRTPVEQAFSYVSKCGGKCQWVIVSNFREIRLYPANDSSIYQKFMIEKLDDIIVLKQFYALLAKDMLFLEKGVSSTDSLLSLKIEGDANISKEFYAEYKKHRSILFNHIKENNPNIDENTILTKSQKILDRIIFICFCEDKGLIPHKTFRKILEQTKNNSFDRRKDKLWQTVKGLFDAIDKGYPEEHINQFNGGLFKPDEVIDNLVITDSVLADIISLESYDFDSDLNVNILGHIFEQSISDLEELKAIISGEEVDKKKGKRKKDGIFYTPEYITRYIVKEAVGGWLEDKRKELGFYDLPKIDDDMWVNIRTGKTKKNNQTVKAHLDFWLKYREALDNIKVLDPACGSGSFLVQVFDYLRQQRKEVNEEISTFEGIQTDLFNYDTHILSKNIYGVDLNAESVEITKLALWLKTANKNDKLTSLDNNIKCGNSLIDDKSVDAKAFNWNEEFKEIMDNGGFDVIVGNPPYIDSETMSKYLKKERNWLSQNYITTTGNWDIYIPFFEKAFNVLNNKGFLGYITPDKWLSKSFGYELRNTYMPNIAKIKRFGRKVFTDALVDSIVSIFTKNCQDTMVIEDYETDSFSIIHKNDIDEQKRLDIYFTPALKVISKMDKIENKVGNIIVCESACATSDAYLLKPIIHNNIKITQDEYIVINTGTIAKYISKWGYKEMKYLGDNYLYPVCEKLDFSNVFHNTYLEKTKTPKLIIKGLTLLNVCIDEVGNVIPGKSTLIIKNKNINILKFLLSFLNSSLPIFYIKEKYSSMTYNGGITFTKDMFNDMPLPTISEEILDKFISFSDEQIGNYKTLRLKSNKFFELLKGDFKDIEINNSIKSCFDADWSNFLNILKRQKISLLGILKDDWSDRFNRYKTDIDNIKSVIADTDKKIDTLVYQLYGLTDDEIKIIEESLNNEQKK